MQSPQEPESVTFSRGPDGMLELRARQFVARPLTEVFEFFSRPENLERLTPSHLRFSILTPQPIPMGDGTLIDYALRLHGIPLRWQSRIEDFRPPCSFTDRQLRGPYRTWIHQHSFREEPDGTRIEDYVRYQVPGGPLVDQLFVQPSLRKIFAHRHSAIQGIFPRSSPLL